MIDAKRRAVLAALCRVWNADPAHQAAAGRARATSFTPEHQATAGGASWAAFSARWRAAQGVPPLSAEHCRRYVAPDQIRGPCGWPLAPSLGELVHRAWCAGERAGVAAWLDADTEPPPEPGGLWAPAQ